MEVLDILNILIDYIASVGLIGGFLIIVLESIIPIIPLSVFIGINVYNFGNVFGFIIKENHKCFWTNIWRQYVPYNEETEHLIGTREDCPDYYKWWEE